MVWNSRRLFWQPVFVIRTKVHDIFWSLIRTSTLFLDLQHHHVRDRFHVVQCYHCQGYGHTYKFCREKDSAPTCYYCAGSHRSDKCKRREEKHLKCVNCASSKNRAEKLKCATHKASDSLCPFYIREKLRTMARTPGCDESKNVYHQRVKEHQRRRGRI